jgi:hypothetical protein
MPCNDSYTGAESVLRALHWCAVNGDGPAPVPSNFGRAKELGLISGAVNTRITAAGRGVLVALGVALPGTEKP